MCASEASHDPSLRWADELDNSDSDLDGALEVEMKPTPLREPLINARQWSSPTTERQPKSVECHRADFLADDLSDSRDGFNRRMSRNQRKNNARKDRFDSDSQDDFSWRCSSGSMRGSGSSSFTMNSKRDGKWI
ncbi:mediator of RNA polymerase II transcription subunit 26, putative [Babesia ovata]|uniref:Mediator of RNA polymerase II transcription subunit 26, putative n=1 Tax=Babesia ovata TaxID=189622 RepID=A0A2H6KBN8_9APIC|nr:mediator of RNA polymerase II transcription subunit 26, putative [Babesia ovata]GBE60406.1 mediator of RNA polymerase II transcription subunit 26, putative [Babesia ovata]